MVDGYSKIHGNGFSVILCIWQYGFAANNGYSYNKRGNNANDWFVFSKK